MHLLGMIHSCNASLFIRLHHKYDTPILLLKQEEYGCHQKSESVACKISQRKFFFERCKCINVCYLLYRYCGLIIKKLRKKASLPFNTCTCTSGLESAICTIETGHQISGRWTPDTDDNLQVLSVKNMNTKQ